MITIVDFFKKLFTLLLDDERNNPDSFGEGALPLPLLKEDERDNDFCCDSSTYYKKPFQKIDQKSERVQAYEIENIYC